MTKLPILYSRTSTGATQQWQIIVEGNSFRTISGQVGGKLVESKPNKCEPKNAGKANATSGEQQALLEAQAKHKKQLKSNYFEDIKQIDAGAWLECQLCKLYRDHKDKVVWPQVVDHKLNGTCCIVTKGEARTRKNEVYHSIPHITDALSKLMKDNSAIYLHGELFNPKYKTDLGKITECVSVGRKPKDITPELLAKSKDIVQYHIYDGYGFTYKGKFYGADEPFLERRLALYELIKGLPGIFAGEYKLCQNEEEAIAYFKAYVLTGGEGTVIKNPKAGYEHKRSKNCLKMKKGEDAEFEVVALLEGSGNWAGCAKMATCKLNKPATDGRTTFDTNVEGTQEHLRDLWNNRKSWVGKKFKVTVRFQELSPYGIPLIPYSDLLIRDYEG